ncbi:MAG TPA: response regulator [Chitinispirillaceae bacterium]|nr:response regulator [Chitinispirillaceae bacterium]
MNNSNLNIKDTRVVVVDDNEAVVWGITQILKEKGCIVKSANTGTEALLLIREFIPDIMFIDIKLDDIDGCEIARSVRACSKFKSTILVALTGFCDNNTCIRIEKSGFSKLLLKPFYISTLEETVIELIHNRSV